MGATHTSSTTADRAGITTGAEITDQTKIAGQTEITQTEITQTEITQTEITIADQAESTKLVENTAGGTTVDAGRSAAPARRSMFSALAVPNFRVYVLGGFVSNVGTWMQRVAQDWLVLELSGGSGVAIGITTALQFLPMLLLSAYGGLVADRFSKRRVLFLTQTWLALSAALLGTLAVTGVATVDLVYVIAFAFGIGTAFDNPARQAFVSEMVGTDRLPNAIALNSATFHSARIVGPAAAGLIIAWSGSGWAILANSVSYVAFIAALLAINSRQLRPSRPTVRGKGQIREGLAYVIDRPDLLTVLLVAFAVGTFGLNFQLTTALMVQQEFHLGPEQYGLLGTVMAVGSLTGALLAARRRAAPGVRFVVLSALLFGGFELLSGLMPTYLSFAALLPVQGLAGLLTLTAANAAVQLGTDPQLRGRVLALYVTVLMGGTPIGAPIIGWVGETFGPRWTLLGGGLLTIIGVLIALFVYRRRSRSVRQGG